MQSYFHRIVSELINTPGKVDRLQQDQHHTKMLVAKALVGLHRKELSLQPVNAAEFKVFSQFGDDGIIQHLIHHLDIDTGHQIFIEFGVEDYSEANTRFLLENNNWRGLVMDGSNNSVEKIKNTDYYWRHDLTAIAAFVTRENVNDVIGRAGFNCEIGILHIDIDGNDYWVWQALQNVNPIIVIMEYNSVFGSKAAVTVPYDPKFERGKNHYSNLYWGSSLKALWMLGQEKGYELIGSNSAGNNAYFVRRDMIGSFLPLSVVEAYVESRYRESRNARGDLTYLNGRKRLEKIAEMSVFDVSEKKLVSLASLVVE